MAQVTQILSAIEQGDPCAAEQLLPLIYDELRKLAAQRMAQEAADHTFQPTALVHEAYIRLVDTERVQQWNSRGHFFAAAAHAMRRILVDHARRKQADKRGGHLQRRPAELDELPRSDRGSDTLSIDEALEKLSDDNPQVVQLVELKFFSGFTLEEAATILGVSVRTAHRYWAYAKAWLLHEIGEARRE